MNKTLEIVLNINEDVNNIENKCQNIQNLVDLEGFEILI